jgi:hypothetical protein
MSSANIKKFYLVFEKFDTNTSFIYYVGDIKLRFEFEHVCQINKSCIEMIDTITQNNPSSTYDDENAESGHLHKNLILSNLIKFIRNIAGQHGIFGQMTKQDIIEMLLIEVSDNVEFVDSIYRFIRDEKILEQPTVLLYTIIKHATGSNHRFNDEQKLNDKLKMCVDLMLLDFTCDQILNVQQDEMLCKQMGMVTDCVEHKTPWNEKLVIDDQECEALLKEIIEFITHEFHK